MMSTLSPHYVTPLASTTVNIRIDFKYLKLLRCNYMSITATTTTYSIREAARLSGLPSSTLRYYETIGLLAEVPRDQSSSHRRYSEQDLDAAIVVACLQATGMSIEDMRTYLANRRRGVDSATDQISLLERQRTRITREAEELKLRNDYLAVKVAYWRAQRDGKNDDIPQLVTRADQLAAQLRNGRHHPSEEATS